MKLYNLNLEEDFSINLSEITPDFSGLILVYCTGEPTGYITTNKNGLWDFFINMNGEGESVEYECDKLIGLIEKLNDYNNYTYKVIKFV